MTTHNIQAISNAPFVTADGRLTREGYYFLFGINESVGGSAAPPTNSSIADIQLIEEINDIDDSSVSVLSNRVDSLEGMEFMQDDPVFQKTAAVGNSDSVMTWLNA